MYTLLNTMDINGPVIAQSDGTLLLEIANPFAEEARAKISAFSELISSPDYMHTYRISPLSLWNAASAGISYEDIGLTLNKFSKYPVPQSLLDFIRHTIDRADSVVLLPTAREDTLCLKIKPPLSKREILSYRSLKKYLMLSYQELEEKEDILYLNMLHRGTVKQALIDLDYPVSDKVPLKQGDRLDISLQENLQGEKRFSLRAYQKDAVKAFTGDDTPGTGYGTIVMPCGSGKTIVGIAVMAHYKTHTLILTPNIAAAHQWIDEILEKTNISPNMIGEYTGEKKTIKPVTVATYNILTWRPDPDVDFYPHFDLFIKHNWGLIIYDEVHLLPAPVFKITAELQAKRRCGLTATLVREDGKEHHLFALVGPKRYDIPWKQVEEKGWIASALCYEIRIPLPDNDRMEYITADRRKKFKIASTNSLKNKIAEILVKRHRGLPALIIGQYVEQLEKLAKELSIPIITGKTPNKKREEIYNQFKEGKIKTLIVSKVANFSIDLPDAAVAIQISGSFGSRQEEAQRLGRILRPKEHNAYFYSIITRDTVEEEFGLNRQRFLTEQGYKYNIEVWTEEEIEQNG
ncbi:DNA repair helicase XPB [Spirochaetia bacterium 38H-sp]|uniref:DNA 3'-5' helicase n=1 Tax=Rarispira pelagica TaxID=3141764 RepID=A0ABU9UAG5_9SPIR